MIPWVELVITTLHLDYLRLKRDFSLPLCSAFNQKNRFISGEGPHSAVEDLDFLFPLLLFHFTQWASADVDIKVLSDCAAAGAIKAFLFNPYKGRTL